MKMFSHFASLLLVATLIAEPAFAQGRPRPNPGPRPGPSRPGPQPRPNPRPEPRPAPRPEPRPAPRPDPRPAPRPMPRPNPRPIPRPMPYPAPYPRPYPIPAPRPYPAPIPQDQACFFEDINFQGRSFCVRPGQSVRELRDYSMHDRISSAYIPAGYQLSVYEHKDFGGQYLTLAGQVPDIRIYGGLWNDIISSIDFSNY
jgi:hypothetical protein